MKVDSKMTGPQRTEYALPVEQFLRVAPLVSPLDPLTPGSHLELPNDTLLIINTFMYICRLKLGTGIISAISTQSK